MTRGVNCGGGRCTQLTIVLAFSSSAPLIYIGWRRVEAANGSPQVGGILLGSSQFGLPPFLFLFGVGREEGEGGILFPFSFPPSHFLLQFGQPIWEGSTGPLGAGLSPSWPIKAHVVAGGMPGTPSGDPICTRYPWNTSGV